MIDKMLKNLNDSSREDLLRQIRRQMSEDELKKFIIEAWKVLEPGNVLKTNWHIDYLAEELQHLATSFTGVEEVQKRLNTILEKYDSFLCINMPPRELKSVIITVIFPCWLWIKRPNLKICSVSYELGLSIEHNMKRRDIIKSTWFQKNWGNLFYLRRDQDNKGKFENNQRGIMEAISVRGSFTGKGYDLIIFDDLQDPLQADSETMRTLVTDFLKKKAPSRLNDPKTGKFINVQQRLHTNDATGYMKDKLSSIYKFVTIQMEAQKDQDIIFPLSKKVKEIKKGDFLNEQRRGKKEVETLRLQMTTREFNAQYNQDPIAGAYRIVKDDMLHRYTEEYNYRNEVVYTSWDLNVKKNEKEDDDLDSTGGVFGFEHDGDLIIFDYYEEQLGFLEQTEQVKYFDNLFDPYANIVEDKANGTALMDYLNAQHVNGLTPYTPKLSKKKRLELATIEMKAKNVYFVASPKMDELIQKLQKFPDLEHDDTVDAFSQLVNWFFHREETEIKARMLDEEDY